jgi:hypothetical protein
MAVTPLMIKITQVKVGKPPRRFLELDCQVMNQGTSSVCILDAWLRVQGNQDLVAEGRLFCPHHNRVDPAIIPAHATGNGVILIELPTPVLQRIEKNRNGLDVVLSFSSRVRVAEVTGDASRPLLQAPIETYFTETQGEYFAYRIPQSDWVKLLRELEWSELELLEFPTAKLRAVPALARALTSYEQAQGCFRAGQWPECVINCRKAIECMVKDALAENDMKEGLKAVETLIGTGPKAVQLNEVLKAFNRFVQLARHPQHPHVEIGRNDALFSLRTTGNVLSYIAGE